VTLKVAGPVGLGQWRPPQRGLGVARCRLSEPAWQAAPYSRRLPLPISRYRNCRNWSAGRSSCRP